MKNNSKNKPKLFEIKKEMREKYEFERKLAIKIYNGYFF